MELIPEDDGTYTLVEGRIRLTIKMEDTTLTIEGNELPEKTETGSISNQTKAFFHEDDYRPRTRIGHGLVRFDDTGEIVDYMK